MDNEFEETNLTPEERDLLMDAIHDGSPEITAAMEKERLKKRKKILAQHPYSIWYSDSEHVWYTYLPDPVKGRSKHKRSTREKLDDMIVDYYNHCDDQCKAKLTVKEVFDRWINSRVEKGTIKKATRDRYAQVFKRHFLEVQDQYMSDLPPLFWENFLQEELDTRTLTKEAWKALKLDFRGIVTYARRKGIVSYTPNDVLCNIETDNSKYKKNSKTDQEDAFTIQEWFKITDFIITEEHPSNHHLGLLLMAVTGLRVGELSTLKFSDIKKGVIKVKRTETRYKDNNGKESFDILESPKTKAGERPVPIPTNFLWIIDEMRKRNPDSPFVFMYRGKRIKGKGFRNQLYKLCDLLELEYRKSPHKMRKTYASILIDDKVEDADVIKILGHVEKRTAEKNYHRDIGNHTEEKLVSVVDSLPEFQLENFKSNKKAS